jgi:hypothetical protein
VKNSKGELIFSGQALGNPIARTAADQPGARRRLRSGAHRLQRSQRQTGRLRSRSRHEIPRRENRLRRCREPGLSKYKASGGKLLITHGWVDTGITPETSIWYYESVLNKMGNNQSDWLRLFMAPGMGHCGGGPGVNTFDSIGTLEKWVEKGIAPDTMLGHGCEWAVTAALPVSAVRGIQRHAAT